MKFSLPLSELHVIEKGEKDKNYKNLITHHNMLHVCVDRAVNSSSYQTCPWPPWLYPPSLSWQPQRTL